MTTRILIEDQQTIMLIIIIVGALVTLIIGIFIYIFCRRNSTKQQKQKKQNNSKKELPKTHQKQDSDKIENRMDTSMTKKEFFVIEEEPEKKNENYNPGDINDSAINLSNVFNLEGEGKQYQNTKYSQIRQN